MLTPPGQDERSFPPLSTSEASCKAAEAAKKKADELKKTKGAEKRDAPTLPTVEEKNDSMDVDEVGASEAPAAPVTGPTLAPGGEPPQPPLAKPADLSGVDSFEDLMIEDAR